jgi:hypothetical protein
VKVEGNRNLKLYTNDRLVPYKTTRILNPLSTKSEIDGLLARYGIKKSAWEWDLENSRVSLQFQISEVIHDRSVEPVVKIEPPTIWNKGGRSKKESINWAVSMRIMFWFLKSHLEMAYLMQSSKTQEFLPFILNPETGKTLKDILIPRLDEIRQLEALPEMPAEETRVKVVDATPKETD